MSGKCKGKIDVYYYTPHPYIKRYTSMKELMYFERNNDWDGFHYESGEKRSNYKSLSFKEFGKDPNWKENWNDPDLNKKGEALTKELNARKERFDKKPENYKLDMTKRNSVYETLHFNEGIYTGKTYPDCLDWPKNLLESSNEPSSNESLIESDTEEEPTSRSQRVSKRKQSKPSSSNLKTEEEDEEKTVTNVESTSNFDPENSEAESSSNKKKRKIVDCKTANKIKVRIYAIFCVSLKFFNFLDTIRTVNTIFIQH